MKTLRRAAMFTIAVLSLAGAALASDMLVDHWPLDCVNSTLFTLSFELHDAPCASTAPVRVELWLMAHRRVIVNESNSFGVDPQAVAAIIAYESLDDIHLSSVFGLTRSSGPGKVHFKAGYFSQGWPVARRVEALGLVRVRSEESRRAFLATDTGSIRYIAAILRALSSAARTPRAAACSPEILTALYAQFDVPYAHSMAGQSEKFLNALRQQRAARWVEENRSVFQVIPPSQVCTMTTLR